MDAALLAAYRATARELWFVPWGLAGVYMFSAYTVRDGSPVRNTRALKWVACAWNTALSAMSVWMAVRIGVLVVESIAERGLAEEACDSRVERAFPMAVFCASKLIELGDTLLLVIRGRPLSVLHVWHHASVMVYCWSAWGVSAPAGSLYGLMNCIVHSVMYPYFALQSCPHDALATLKVRVRAVSSAITVLQTAQMAAGLALALFTLRCAPPEAMLNMQGAVGMYLSYLVLFVELYMKRAPVKKAL
jgi:hypothetical protein